MLSKQQMLDLITEEKNKYSSYLQLCAFYKVEPDPIVVAKHISKIETYDLIIKYI